MTMMLTVLRGLRSRALLSGGSVLLISLAIGSAVLGPIFAVAVTDSFLVSRLDEAPNALTGLSWRFDPDGQDLEDGTTASEQAIDDAVAAADGQAPDDLFAPPQTMLETERLPVYGGLTKLGAKEGACDHLDIEGSCPARPGEVMLLEGDLELTGSEIGQEVDLGDLGVVEIVGTYLAPGPDEADFWFERRRFEEHPATRVPVGDVGLPAGALDDGARDVRPASTADVERARRPPAAGAT